MFFVYSWFIKKCDFFIINVSARFTFFVINDQMLCAKMDWDDIMKSVQNCNEINNDDQGELCLI